MDNDDLLFYAEQYRLRTARQKKRLQKKDFEKQLLRIDREQEMLSRKHRELPLIPLEEPYQKGWKRTFVLRPDLCQSKDAAFYTTLLEKINTTYYSVNRSFLIKTGRRKKGKKVFEVRPQELRYFRYTEWYCRSNKLTAAERMLFHKIANPLYRNERIAMCYAFSEPWRFVLQTACNMITHIQATDEVLEQEIVVLENRIEKHHLRHRINKLTWGYSWRRHADDTEKAKYKNPLHNKPLHRILYEAELNE